MVVREKTHSAEPMTLDQALEAMELVGHDFYLYVDARQPPPSRRLPAPRLPLRGHPPGPRHRLTAAVDGWRRPRELLLPLLAPVRPLPCHHGRVVGGSYRGVNVSDAVASAVGLALGHDPTGESQGGSRGDAPDADPGARGRRPRALPARPGDGPRLEPRHRGGRRGGRRRRRRRPGRRAAARHRPARRPDAQARRHRRLRRPQGRRARRPRSSC